MAALTPEQLAKIRADDEAAGPWLGGPDEKFRFVNQRRELLAHIDHLTAERDEREQILRDELAVFEVSPNADFEGIVSSIRDAVACEEERQELITRYACPKHRGMVCDYCGGDGLDIHDADGRTEVEALTVRVAELEAAQRRGRCGDRLTGIAWRSSDPRQPLLICALPHGHPGWHRSDDGGEWTPLDGSEPQP